MSKVVKETIYLWPHSDFPRTQSGSTNFHKIYETTPTRVCACREHKNLWGRRLPWETLKGLIMTAAPLTNQPIPSIHPLCCQHKLYVVQLLLVVGGTKTLASFSGQLSDLSKEWRTRAASGSLCGRKLLWRHSQREREMHELFWRRGGGSGPGFGRNVSINLHNCTRRVKLEVQVSLACSLVSQSANTWNTLFTEENHNSNLNRVLILNDKEIFEKHFSNLQ